MYIHIFYVYEKCEERKKKRVNGKKIRYNKKKKVKITRHKHMMCDQSAREFKLSICNTCQRIKGECALLVVVVIVVISSSLSHPNAYIHYCSLKRAE